MASLLDGLIPAPRLLELDHVDLAAPVERVWELVRHGNLASSPLIHALFWLRALPELLRGRHQPSSLFIDDLKSTPAAPGFQVLAETATSEFAIGAIGKVWHGEIPFVHVDDAVAFAQFQQPDFVKVAWSIRLLPRGERDCRLELEVRVDATDDEAWHKFENYFRLIGPGSHFIRRVLLTGLARELGTPNRAERSRPLPGDELLGDATAELTEGITIAGTPEQIWPWLVQIGCRRAGFYSVDWLDNAGQRSSRELVPELGQLSVGQVVPAAPDSDEGFEVLRVDANQALILGGLYDVAGERQLPFATRRPERFWQVTWAFVLERLDPNTTRLHTRARAAFPSTGSIHAAWIRPVHHFMQRHMLEGLAARVERRLPHDDYRDVLSGVTGAALMLVHLATPFLRGARKHWGLSEAEAAQARPGDELIPNPDWSWTHAVKVAASTERVWRWLAQMGADRAGFYSYQWLENLLGCELENADAVHPEWELAPGAALVLHPKAAPLRVVLLERGRFFVAQAPAEPLARAAGKPWVSASWLFALEPSDTGGCRVLSRYRASCSADLVTRLSFGPTLLEPIGFAMDRRMLLGVKQRAEREARYALVRVGPERL